MQTNTPEEIVLIEKGAKLLSRILSDTIAQAKVGASGLELSLYAEEEIKKLGATPAFKGYGNPPFPHTVCVSANECVVHGVPSETQFKKGDLVGFDIGMVYNGFYSDMARTVMLETIDSREKQLVQCAKSALYKAVEIIKPGATTGDIGSVIQKHVEGQGFGVVRDLAGHGVGKSLHEEPEIPNFGKPGTGPTLKSGMVIALEPMITLGDWRVKVADDKWSVVTRDGSKTAHHEDMILITDDGCRVLTE